MSTAQDHKKLNMQWFNRVLHNKRGASQHTTTGTDVPPPSGSHDSHPLPVPALGTSRVDLVPLKSPTGIDEHYLFVYRLPLTLFTDHNPPLFPPRTEPTDPIELPSQVEKTLAICPR